MRRSSPGRTTGSCRIRPRRIPPPMRITFLNPAGVGGGAERVLLAAVRGAPSTFRPRLGVVLFAEGPLRAEAEQLGATVTVVPLPASLNGRRDASDVFETFGAAP